MFEKWQASLYLKTVSSFYMYYLILKKLKRNNYIYYLIDLELVCIFYRIYIKIKRIDLMLPTNRYWNDHKVVILMISVHIDRIFFHEHNDIKEKKSEVFPRTYILNCAKYWFLNSNFCFVMHFSVVFHYAELFHNTKISVHANPYCLLQ